MYLKKSRLTRIANSLSVVQNRSINFEAFNNFACVNKISMHCKVGDMYNV